MRLWRTFSLTFEEEKITKNPFVTNIDILKQKGTIILRPYHLSYTRIHRSKNYKKIFFLDCPQSQFVPQEL